jgi:predicted acyltransferase
MHSASSAAAFESFSLKGALAVEPEGTMSAPRRYESVDVLRGIAVAAMVVINNPGSWTDGYPLLAHSEWNGCTLADLVFPLFLFVVGISITLSVGARTDRGERAATMAAGIVRRAALLFALGLVLNGFPHFDLAALRIPGVLQRIGLCYLFAGLLVLKTTAHGQGVVAISLLAAYWMLMALVPVPGHGAGIFEEQGNLAGYLDDLVMRGHLYHDGFDPEGMLSTMPAVATTLFGVLAGRWMTSRRSGSARTLGLVAAGCLGLAIGTVMDAWFPINKQLWTSSFAVFTAGAAAVSCGFCYWLIEVKGWRLWAVPFFALGTNALAVYAFSSLVASLLESIHVTSGPGTSDGLRLYLFEHLFLPWAGSQGGSLCFAVVYLMAWLWAMTLLYRRRIFIRI